MRVTNVVLGTRATYYKQRHRVTVKFSGWHNNGMTREGDFAPKGYVLMCRKERDL